MGAGNRSQDSGSVEERDMKQLIVLLGVLPLLLIFMMQYTLDQKNSTAISLLQEQVYTAKEQAKQEGYFTPEIRQELRKNISRSLDIPEEEIIIEATETRKYRLNYFDESGERGIIHYEVSVPIKRLMAGTNLLGIDKEENTGVYTIKGTAASECLP